MIFKLPLLASFILSVEILFAQPETNQKENKSLVVRFIDQHHGDLISWSDKIWNYAEPSFKEFESSKLLIEVLRNEGFAVEENICGLSTVFVATYGSGKPVVGLYGEYDADPNASNKSIPRKEELRLGGYGHGGGHNLLGVGSLGAALAIKNLISQKKLNGTIRYYGSTAEGGMGVRAYLARDNYFNDLDFSLYWHPSPVTSASTSIWDALIEFDITFVAKRLNVIHENTNDPNTLSAFEMFTGKMEPIRKQISRSVRINYAVRQWRNEINEIPDTLKIGMKIQCVQQLDALKLYNQVRDAVNDIGTKTNVMALITINKAMHQFLPNVTAMKTVHENMQLLGPINYTAEEQNFVKELQRFIKVPESNIEDKILAFSDRSKPEQIYGYASDIGDASWIAPEAYFVVKTLPPVKMHQWQGSIFSGYSIGHKGMIQAAKILAMTIVDYVEDKALQDAIRQDFMINKKPYNYQPILPSGSLPIDKFIK